LIKLDNYVVLEVFMSMRFSLSLLIFSLLLPYGAASAQQGGDKEAAPTQQDGNYWGGWGGTGVNIPNCTQRRLDKGALTGTLWRLKAKKNHEVWAHGEPQGSEAVCWWRPGVPLYIYRKRSGRYLYLPVDDPDGRGMFEGYTESDGFEDASEGAAPTPSPEQPRRSPGD
jgi:hypothetical protein